MLTVDRNYRINIVHGRIHDELATISVNFLTEPLIASIYL